MNAITVAHPFTCSCCQKTSNGSRIVEVVQYKDNPPHGPVAVEWDGVSKEGENDTWYYRGAEKLPADWFQIEWSDSGYGSIDRYVCGMECAYKQIEADRVNDREPDSE